MQSKLKIVIAIQARMGSGRLPGKTLMKFGKHTVLEYMYKRLQRVRKAHEIILATTDNPKDDPIVMLAENIGFKYHRGSEDDVLGRVYEGVKQAGADIVVLTTGDCPMIDASIIDQMIELYLRGGYDCVGNGMIKSYPHGLDAYIVSMDVLSQANTEAKESFEREHVVEFITSHPERFKNYYIQAPGEHNRPDIRITLDRSKIMSAYPV